MNPDAIQDRVTLSEYKLPGQDALLKAQQISHLYPNIAGSLPSTILLLASCRHTKFITVAKGKYHTTTSSRLSLLKKRNTISTVFPVPEGYHTSIPQLPWNPGTAQGLIWAGTYVTEIEQRTSYMQLLTRPVCCKAVPCVYFSLDINTAPRLYRQVVRPIRVTIFLFPKAGSF